jgi:phosphohistidine phosphatase
MKSVLLLRHAKSDWGDSDLPDFDRPLAKRGLIDAPQMGRVLLKYHCVPDQIISSPAKRAQQTSQLLAESCEYNQSIQWDASFYGGDSDDLLNALKRLPAWVERAMLVGHNPTMEETAGQLLGGPDNPPDLSMPTAGLVCLDLHLDNWALVRPGSGILRWFLVPKLLKAIGYRP